MRAGRVGAAGGTLLLVLAAACRQLVGIGDEPPTDLTPDASTPKIDAGVDAEAGPTAIAYASAQCEACLQSHCTPQAIACAGDPACNGLETCLGACDGGAACRAHCVSANLIGPNSFETGLAACLATSCVQQCGIPCGGFEQYFGVDAAVACQGCIEANGCQAALSCAQDPACQAAVWCIVTNSNPDLEGDCVTQHDPGFGDAGFGLPSSCTNDCAVGSQWYCVGDPPPPATNSTSAFTLTLYDVLLGATHPIANATVVACSPIDANCSSPLTSPQASGDGGVVTVIVPSNAGYLSISGANLVPELFVPADPFSVVASGSDTLPVFTQSDLSTVTAAIPVPVDLSRGIVVAAVHDCDAFGSGVTLEIHPSDGETQVLYFLHGVPSLSVQSTDSTGAAAIVNVPVDAGPITVTATPLVLGGRPSTEMQAFAWPGTVTYLSMVVNQ